MNFAPECTILHHIRIPNSHRSLFIKCVAEILKKYLNQEILNRIKWFYLDQRKTQNVANFNCFKKQLFFLLPEPLFLFIFFLPLYCQMTFQFPLEICNKILCFYT